MTLEEAAEAVLLGPFEGCLVCGGTGRRPFMHGEDFVRRCEPCKGTGNTLRPRYFEAGVMLGLTSEAAQHLVDHALAATQAQEGEEYRRRVANLQALNRERKEALGESEAKSQAIWDRIQESLDNEWESQR